MTYALAALNSPAMCILIMHIFEKHDQKQHLVASYNIAFAKTACGSSLGQAESTPV